MDGIEKAFASFAGMSNNGWVTTGLDRIEAAARALALAVLKAADDVSWGPDVDVRISELKARILALGAAEKPKPGLH